MEFAVRSQLQVGPTGDPLEREADQVAGAVQRVPRGTAPTTPDPPPADPPSDVQRFGAQSGSPGADPAAPIGLGEDSDGRIRRLAIGSSDDRFERQADDLASSLHGGKALPDAPASLPAPAEARPDGAEATGEAPGEGNTRSTPAPKGWATASGLQSGGQPLPGSVRRFYETRLGYDFSGVRLHSGPDALRLSNAIDAHAFTYRSHVWMGRGAPTGPSYTLSHELVHVAQQTRPGPFRPREGIEPAAASRSEMADTRTDMVRRLTPYWVPETLRAVSDEPRAGGGELHDEILHDVFPQSIGKEIGVPNADARDWGLGLEGRADLYRASSTVGIYFRTRRGQSPGDKYGNERYRNPARLRYRGDDPNPRLEAGAITHIQSAPTDIGIGDLKPATLDSLTGGRTQLGNYEEGFRDTRSLTNQWAAASGSTDQWGGSVSFSVGRLPAVTIPSQYRPGRREQNRELVIADLRLTRHGYRTPTVFNPRRHLNPPQTVRGDLYVQFIEDGLWAYYAVPEPAERDAALGALGHPAPPTQLARPHSEYIQQADLVSANAATLKTQLDAVQTLSRRRRDLPGRTQAETPSTEGSLLGRRPVEPDTGTAVVRPRRTARLRDPFDRGAYNRWLEERRGLRRLFNRGAPAGRAGRLPSESDLARLRLLSLVYEAEEELHPRARRQDLPDERQMRVRIEPERHGAPDPIRRPRGARGRSPGRAISRSLPDLYPWMERWTGQPADVLGLLRFRFGTALVSISRRIARARERIRQRMQGALRQRSGLISRRGWVGIAVRALSRAMREVGALLLSHAMHLVFQAVQQGVERKLEALFDPGEVALLEETLEEYRQLADELQRFQADVQSRIDELQERYGDDLEIVQDVVDLAQVMGPIIEVAMVIVQCGSPPGWGCLKLLAQEAARYLVDRIVETCTVQRWIQAAMLEIGWFRELPVSLAQRILGILHGAAPPALKDVFEGPIPYEPGPGSEEIPCAEASGEARANAQALVDFNREQGPETVRALIALGDSRGMPDRAPLTPDVIAALRGQLEQTGATPAQMRALAAGSAGEEVRRRLQPLVDRIDTMARGAIGEQLLTGLREGRFDRRFRQMRQQGRRIDFPDGLPGGGRPGAFAPNQRVLYDDGTTRAVGVAHVIVGNCHADRTVDLRTERLQLWDAEGRPVEPRLESMDLSRRSRHCLRVRPPPPSGGATPPSRPPPEQPPPPPPGVAQAPEAQEPGISGVPPARGPSPRGSGGTRGQPARGPRAVAGSGAGRPGAAGSRAGWPIWFENRPGHGFELRPGDPDRDPAGSNAILLPDNQSALLFPVHSAGTLVLRIGGPWGREVARARQTEAARQLGTHWWEMESGSLYDDLMRALPSYLESIRQPISAYPLRLFFSYTGMPAELQEGGEV